MSKYHDYFKISFISYILILIAAPYVTAQAWADLFFFIFLASVLYQLVYIIYLRKKDNLKMSSAIGMCFYYAFIFTSIFMLYNMFDNFINGYQPTDVVGQSIGQRLYGFKAITSSGIIILEIPWLIITALMISKRKKKHNKETK